MPVTAKLSRKFYETFGDEVANELVEWFNAVDATYRTELREINELNFARFEATLDNRVQRLERRLDQIETMVAGVPALDQRIHALEVKLESEVGRLETVIRSQTSELRREMLTTMAQMEARMTGRLLRWMFVFWTGTTITLLGAMFAITRL